MTIHVRAFPYQIERRGSRTLVGRLVPYGVVADVADPTADGRFEVYQEGFRPGAFAPQITAAAEKGVLNKISLVHRHEGGLGYLGPFTGLREGADGLYGEVEILRSKADDVEDLLAAGVDELSVEFRLPKMGHTEVADDGVRWRTRAHLDGVALEPRGAYRSAQVLAYRAEVDEEARAEAEARAKEQAESEAAAAAIATRRAQWDALMARLDSDLERQAQLVRDYGVTQVPRRPL